MLDRLEFEAVGSGSTQIEMHLTVQIWPVGAYTSGNAQKNGVGMRLSSALSPLISLLSRIPAPLFFFFFLLLLFLFLF